MKEWIKDWKESDEKLDDILFAILPGFLYRFLHRMRNVPRNIKHTYQRATVGHTDDDWWNINNFVLYHCLPMIKTLREKHNGHPMDLTDKKWHSILNEIIEGWELWELDMEDHIDLLMSGREKDKKKYWGIVVKRQVKIDKANMLFGKYLQNLWD